MPRFALGLVGSGLLLNLSLVVLILSEGVAPARLNHTLAAVLAAAAGLLLVSGLALLEPRRHVQAFSG